MDIKPITREEMYLAKAAGQEVSPPEPITRKEMFLAKIAGMEVETPGAITRIEMFANKAAVALNRSVIEPLEITENGTYTAPEGVDGYNPVTVEVVGAGGGSGGGSLPPGAYLSASPIGQPNTYRQKRFMYNGEVYVGSGSGAGDGYLTTIYKWNGSTWITVVTAPGNKDVSDSTIDCDDFKVVEYKGNAHIFSGKKHSIFNGTTVTTSTDVPGGNATPIVQSGKLFAHSYDNYTLYEWDDTNNVWNTVEKLTGYYYPVVVNDEIYFTKYVSYNVYAIYRYVDGALTEVGSITAALQNAVVVNDMLYYLVDSTYYTVIYRFDFTTAESVEVGRIPGFSEMFYSQNTNEISFNASLCVTRNASYVDKYPFFVVNIVEATE